MPWERGKVHKAGGVFRGLRGRPRIPSPMDSDANSEPQQLESNTVEQGSPSHAK
jgi:hypothetical protein